MSHGPTGDDGQDVKQVIPACSRSQGLRERDHEVEYGVEEDGDAQQEAAAQERSTGSSLPKYSQRTADDSVGGTTVEQALADNRRHGND